jgi:hypothetical protein
MDIGKEFDKNYMLANNLLQSLSKKGQYKELYSKISTYN